MLNHQEERERPYPPLAGEIYQARRLDKRQRGVVHFAKGGLGVAIELPAKQAELIGEYLAKEPSEMWHFWVYPEETIEGRAGVVIAGPLSEGITKSRDLLSDVQMARWFNQLLSPLGEISRVEEIDPIGKTVFRVNEDKEVGFKEIWNAFEKEERKEKKGERRGEQWRRAMKIPPRSTIGKEARTKLKRIIES